MAVRYKRILVPFAGLPLPEQIFALALTVAQALAAEVILLRVNPPIEATSHAVDGERLYTELRALQAQLQNCTVPIKVEMMPGPAEESIISYADQKGIDLIVITNQQRLGGQSQEQNGSPETIFRDAHFATLIVPEDQAPDA